MDLSDFEKILDCKHLLVSSGLKSVPLQDKDDFAYYLRAFELLIENEPCFVLLDERIPALIKNIVSYYRSPENNDRINKIIIFLNNPSLQPNTHRQQYISWQLKIHGYNFYDEIRVFNCLESDYSVYSALKFKQMDFILLDDYFLSSINYLLYMVPQFFEGDVSKMVLDKLKQFRCFPFPRRVMLICNILKMSKKVNCPKQKIKEFCDHD